MPKINYTIYPTGANNGNVTFKSDDEEIATVSPEGIITAHKKGYTFIEISVGYSSQKVLVVVDMDTKDVFNEILGVVSSHQVIDYYSIIVNSQYSEDPLADAIRNNISNELYGEGYHIFSVEVAKEEDEYYIRISMYNEDVYSDYLKITYELKGIHVSNRNYYIADGETIDTDLFFTEGDNLNLYVSIEDETVASYDTTGKLIGLKTGVTGVNVSDKYNNYHVYFKVYVNYDEYVSNLQKEITSQPLEVDYIKFTQNNRYYDSVVSSVLNFTYDLYNLNNTSTHYDCDEENNVCDFIFKQNDETIMEFTIDVNLVGIKLPEKEVYLNKDEMKDINYELFVKYEHEIGSDKYMANKEMYDSSIKLSKILYQQIYDDYVPADSDLFFFGMPYEINNGDRMLLPIGTLFFNDKNHVEFIGSEIWVSTEGGWENNIKEAAASGTIFGDKLRVCSTSEQRMVVGEMNDTFCELTNEMPKEEEVVVQNGYKLFVPSDELVK